MNDFRPTAKCPIISFVTSYVCASLSVYKFLVPDKYKYTHPRKRKKKQSLQMNGEISRLMNVSFASVAHSEIPIVSAEEKKNEEALKTNEHQ